MSIGDRETPTYWLGVDAEGPDDAWAECVRVRLRERKLPPVATSPDASCAVEKATLVNAVITAELLTIVPPTTEV